MNKNLTLVFDLLIFAAGAAVGSVITWRLIKDKYETKADEEIQSVKEIYSQKLDECYKAIEKPVKPKTDIQVEQTKVEQEEYSVLLDKLNYAVYGEVLEKKNEEDKKVENAIEKDRPYVISPAEFGELEDYDQESLTWYADHYLVNSANEVIYEIDEVVGKDFASHFGEYEADSVFVRNDALKIDYEILLDLSDYDDE